MCQIVADSFEQGANANKSLFWSLNILKILREIVDYTNSNIELQTDVVSFLVF